MRMYFDESGTFKPHPSDSSGVAIAVGVAVPATVQAPLFAEFASLKTTAFGCSRPDEELKGHRLDDTQRRAFCKMLDGHPRVLIRPVILALQDCHGASFEQLRDTMRQAFEEVWLDLPPGEARAEVAMLRSMHIKLSDAQLARLFAWANCVDRTLRDAAMEWVPDHERESWSALELIIDGPASTATQTEGRFFSTMLQHWMGIWSHEFPFASLATSGRHHPLIEHFQCDYGLNVRHIVERGLRFRDSATETGIQLADVAAAIVGTAARRRDSDQDSLYTYGWLMKHASERAQHGIGLVTPKLERRNEHATEFLPLIQEYDRSQVRRQLALHWRQFFV